MHVTFGKSLCFKMRNHFLSAQRQWHCGVTEARIVVVKESYINLSRDLSFTDKLFHRVRYLPFVSFSKPQRLHLRSYRRTITASTESAAELILFSVTSDLSH